MRALVQSLKDGTSELIDAASPAVRPGHVVIRSVASVLSAGTERMLVEFGRANPIAKARQQPDRVRQVIEKARTDGIRPTVEAVRSKLDQPIPLGYANAGHVIELGPGVHDLAVGQLVASNGPHAEIVAVPRTLVAAVPDGVDARTAAFASIASVGLQGIRLAEPTLGERFVVIGLGLIGQLTVQLLRAQGCSVLGVDLRDDRLALAAAFGADVVSAGDQVEAAASRFSLGRGVDGVIIAASTASSEPVLQAARMCRRKGRVVLVGVTGLELARDVFYERELTFAVSSSYGPGRDDLAYAPGANDYPFGHVRWTAGRNFEAFLDLAASGGVDVGSVVTHSYAFSEALEAYETLVSEPSALGIVLDYGAPAQAGGPPPLSTIVRRSSRPSSGRVALIGTGGFANQVLVPALRAGGAEMIVVAGRDGTAASLTASRADAARSTTDLDTVFDDQEVDTVFIATRHDSHAELVVRALDAGKHVFVEKPLVILDDELVAVTAAVRSSPAQLLGIGFNRRFAPITLAMRNLLVKRPEPKVVLITVNAGTLPHDHWLNDPDVGGGRVIGEGCHFIDLARHLAGASITEVSTSWPGNGVRDSATISLGFADGSQATIHYLTNGSKRFPKERVEVFCGGGILVNDNFRSMRSFGWPGAKPKLLRRQEKGHRASVARFLDATRTGSEAPIPTLEILEVSRATLQAAGSSER